MAYVTLTSENFEQEVLRSDRPVLVDFWATWCGPCRMLAPTIEEIANEQSTVKVCKLDVDENMELAQRYQVTSIPTLILFQDGKIVRQSVGGRSKEDLLKFINVSKEPVQA